MPDGDLECHPRTGERAFVFSRSIAPVVGGTLLVLGASGLSFDANELSSPLEPHYLLARAFDGLSEIDAQETSIFDAMQAATSGSSARSLFSSLRAAELLHSQYTSSMARTTAIDGATLVSADGSLLAFGCKVLLQSTPTIRVRLPTVAPAAAIELANFGGTRHQSAARFVGRYPGSRAVVSSQDGKVSLLNHIRADEVDCLEHAEWCF